MIETLKQSNARIKASNRRFMKMSKPRRRVAIARDVIAQLATGKLVATSGIYVESPNLKTYDSNVELQSLLLPPTVSCDVCGIGSLFVCGIQRANKFTTGDAKADDGSGAVSGRIAFKYLERFFDRSQLQLIEATFEGWGSSQCVSFHDSVRIVDDGEADKARLRLIMENIIANKGTFVPSIRPHMSYVTPGFKG